MDVRNSSAPARRLPSTWLCNRFSNLANDCRGAMIHVITSRGIATTFTENRTNGTATDAVHSRPSPPRPDGALSRPSYARGRPEPRRFRRRLLAELSASVSPHRWRRPRRPAMACPDSRRVVGRVIHLVQMDAGFELDVLRARKVARATGEWKRSDRTHGLEPLCLAGQKQAIASSSAGRDENDRASSSRRRRARLGRARRCLTRRAT